MAEAFPALERATVLDGSADALALGQRIGRHGPAPWPTRDLDAGRCSGRVSLCRRPTSAVVSYVLGELAERAARAGGRRAMASAAQLVLVIEPGTPRGYAAVLAARSRLTDAGWHLLAPCPQDGAVPGGRAARDWCHFAVRLDRSAAAPAAQGRRLGHEDEKFSYVLASRAPGDAGGGPRAAASGHPKGPRAARGLRLRRVQRGGSWSRNATRSPTVQHATPRGGTRGPHPGFASVDTIDHQYQGVT